MEASLGVVADADGDAVLFGEFRDVLLDVVDDLAVRPASHVQEAVQVAANGKAALKLHADRALQNEFPSL